MSHKRGDKPDQKTDRIASEAVKPSIAKEDVTYRAVPDGKVPWGSSPAPVWRVLFTLAANPKVRFGLDINGEVVLGRGKEGSGLVDLSQYEAEDLGVSRHHISLRPEGTKLFVLDLDSTNGTLRNGRSIGVKTPYLISDGDILTLGRLDLIVNVMKRPLGQTALLVGKADLADALAELAKAITSELKLDEVLRQSLDMAMSLTEAGEAAIWLVDDQTGELFLEAEHGIEDEEIKRLRLPVTDSLAGEVIRTGKPVRASREKDGEPIKIKTGYLVEALLYAPLTLGGVTFGVLAAAHRVPDLQFTDHDERLLTGIADFAAIAVQNARLYEATDKALARRVEELAALNELSHAVTATLNLDTVHKVLIEQVRKRWEVEAAALWLVDEGTQAITPYAGAEEGSEDITRQVFKPGEGIIGEVVLSGEAIAHHAVESEAAPSGQTPMVTRAKSMACVPLKISNQVIGVLALINRRKGFFSDADLAKLQGFAHPMAVAIENARLYAQSEFERAIIHATADTLPQPLMIVGHRGEHVLSNDAAAALLEAVQRAGGGEGTDQSSELDQLLEGLSHGLGRTTEIAVGDEHYLATVSHAPKVGTITVMQNITHKRQLEQAQSEFVDALSHDLRTPLASIKGFAQMVEMSQSLDEAGAQFLKRIVQTTERMLGMVDQLLNIALLTRSPQTKRKPCELGLEVATAVSDLEGAALARSVELDVELTGEPYKIMGDAQRLYRSVLNLVSNAIKFSPENTTVLTTIAFCDKGVRIQVRDQGPGIPEDELPYVFDKFYRGKKEPGSELGLGLGLAMVRATVEAHDGEVSAQNAKDGGAEFTILLPASLRVQ